MDVKVPIILNLYLTFRQSCVHVNSLLYVLVITDTSSNISILKLYSFTSSKILPVMLFFTLYRSQTTDSVWLLSNCTKVTLFVGVGRIVKRLTILWRESKTAIPAKESEKTINFQCELFFCSPTQVFFCRFNEHKSVEEIKLTKLELNIGARKVLKTPVITSINRKNQAFFVFVSF